MAIGCAVLLAACAAQPTTSPQTAPAPRTSVTVSPAAPASPTAAARPAAAPPTAGPGTVTLAFGGDVHFTDYLADLLDDPTTSLRSLRDTLGAADLAMVNLETSITGRGTPQPKSFHFRTTPAALDALRAVGVDVVTMANNHAADYGPLGLQDTLEAKRDSPIPIVGIGSDAEQAYAPAVLTAGGLRVAVFGSTQIFDLTAARFAAGPDSPGVAVNQRIGRLRAAVAQAAGRYDLVVVYLHWGTDYTTCPDSLQRFVATALESAGADVIVGTHAHRVQGAGWLGRAYVGYGLGNFVWWRSAQPDSRSGVLTLTVDATAARSGSPGPAVRAATWTPMLVTRTGMPQVETGSSGASLLASWKQARRCTGLSAAPD